MVSVSIVYDSSFKGQTEVLAKCVLEGVNSVDNVKGYMIHVKDVDDHWNLSLIHISEPTRPY